MERQFEKRRVREFAPGITDPGEFMKLVDKSVYARAGGPAHEGVNKAMTERIDQLDRLLGMRAYSKHPDFKHRKMRDEFLIEKAIIVELFYQTELLPPK